MFPERWEWVSKSVRSTSKGSGWRSLAFESGCVVAIGVMLDYARETVGTPTIQLGVKRAGNHGRVQIPI